MLQNDGHDLVKEMESMKRDIEDLKKREKSEVSLANHPVIAMIQNDVVDLKTDVREMKEKMDLLADWKEELRDEVKKASAEMKSEAKEERDNQKKESDAVVKRLEALISSQTINKPRGTYSNRNKVTVNTIANPSTDREVMVTVNSSDNSRKVRPKDPPQVDPRAWRRKVPSTCHDPVN